MDNPPLVVGGGDGKIDGSWGRRIVPPQTLRSTELLDKSQKGAEGQAEELGMGQTDWDWD